MLPWADLALGSASVRLVHGQKTASRPGNEPLALNNGPQSTPKVLKFTLNWGRPAG